MRERFGVSDRPSEVSNPVRQGSAQHGGAAKKVEGVGDADSCEVESRRCAGNWGCSIKDNVSVEEGIRQVDSVRVQRGDDVSARSEVLRTADGSGTASAEKENNRAQLCC